MRIEDTGTGMVLTQNITDKTGAILLEKGITLTENHIQHLKHLGLSTIQASHPLSQTLKRTIAPGLREELADCFKGLFQLKAADVLNFFPPAAVVNRLHPTIDKVISEVAGLMDDMATLNLRQPFQTLEEHAANVCLLSVATGLYLHFDVQTLHELALGSLLHDLGKSMQPLEAHAKAYLHTIYGHELIMRCGLGTTIARIAAEHHETYSGTGYPKGLSSRNIHPLSRLVTITNYYDCSLNRDGLSVNYRQELFESMLSDNENRFDQNLVRAFWDTVPVFPSGSLVRLNTGQLAYIVRNNTHFPLRPMVRIVEDVASFDIDLAMKLNLTITELILE